MESGPHPSQSNSFKSSKARPRAWRLWNLRTAIVLPPLVLLLTIGFLLGYLAEKNIAVGLEREKAARLQAVSLAAQQIDYVTSDALLSLKAVGSTNLITARSTRAHDDALQQTLFGHPALRAIFLIDSEGNQVTVQPPEGKDSFLLVPHNWLAGILAGNGPEIAELPIKSPDGKVSLVMGAAARDDSGRLRGAIIGLVDPLSSKRNFLAETLHYGQTGYNALISSDGNIIASSNPARLFQKSELADRSAVLIKSQEASVITQSDRDQPSGREVAVIAPIPSAHLLLTSEQDLGEFNAPLTALMQEFILVGAILTVLIIVTALGAAGLLSLPLLRLSKAAGQISGGDFDVAVPEKGVAEIADLGKAIAEMRRHLKQRVNRLQAMGDVGVSIAQGLRPDAVFDTFVQDLRPLINFKQADIYVSDPDGKHATLSFTTSLSIAGPQMGDAFEIVTTPLLGAKDPQYYIIRQSIDFAGASPLEQALSQDGMKSCVAVPLNYRGQATGTLILWASTGAAFEPEDIEILQPLAAQLSVAMANARLFTALEASRTDWQQTFDTTMDGLAIVGPDQQILRANKAMAGLIGSGRLELSGEYWYRVVYNLNAPKPDSSLTRALIEKRTIEIARQRQKGGQNQWLALRFEPILSGSGTVTRAVVTVRDISEIKRAEEEAEERFQHLTQMAGAARDAVILVQDTSEVQARHVLANKVWSQITGFSETELLSQSLFDLVRPADRQAVVEVARRWLDGKDSPGLSEVYISGKSGTEVPVQLFGTPAAYHGRPAAVCYFRDLTESKELEKLKDQFIGLVSHELRTPLTVLTGSLSTVLSSPELPAEESRRLLVDAFEESQDMANIVTNLLELSRANANKLILQTEVLDVGTELSSTLEKVKKQHPDHSFKAVLPRNFNTVRADPIRLERVVYNLLDNAAKYSPEGSEVRVSCKRLNGEIVVSVSDQGEGISPENQAKLFTPFERLGKDASTRTGTGLGLVVCRRLVEAHGGRIWVDSTPGKGSTFHFTLPRIPEINGG